MTIIQRDYAHGTNLRVSGHWGLYVGGHAMCSDGKVRKLKRIAHTADTFFSVPAAVNVTVGHRGVTVAGYVTVQCASGSEVPTDDDPAIVMFSAYQYRQNAWALPPGLWRSEETPCPQPST